MTKQTHVRVGGGWKPVTNVHVRQGGIWKEQVMPSVRVNGSYLECMEYTVNYNVGDIGPGGGLIVAVKNEYSNGWKYLEMAPKTWYNGSSDPTAFYGCLNVDIPTGQFINSSKTNTDAILAACPTAGIGARLCSEYSSNGLSDWFMLASFGYTGVLGDFTLSGATCWGNVNNNILPLEFRIISGGRYLASDNNSSSTSATWRTTVINSTSNLSRTSAYYVRPFRWF